MVFMMGVEWADCPLVAEIVGVKFFINEFVAYQQLSQYKSQRLSGVEEWINGEKQWISVSDNPEKSPSGRFGPCTSEGMHKVPHRHCGPTVISQCPSLTTRQAEPYVPVVSFCPRSVCYFSSVFWPNFDL